MPSDLGRDIMVSEVTMASKKMNKSKNKTSRSRLKDIVKRPNKKVFKFVDVTEEEYLTILINNSQKTAEKFKYNKDLNEMFTKQAERLMEKLRNLKNVKKN